MARPVLSAVCLLVAAPLWAGGPESARLSAQRAFGSLLQAAPIRFQAAQPAPAPAPKPVPTRSPLDFSNVTWPPSLTADDRVAFAAALNISASFEGDDAWSTISSDFDGQGLSLGLLNQNLGQGSLQPLLIKMRDQHADKLAALFGPEHLKSLLDMLRKWEEDVGAAWAAPAPLSLLDEPAASALSGVVSPEAASVAWALANLYSDAGKTFDPVWKQEFMGMAETPEYVSLQIEAALGYHERALAYEVEVKVRELRAYLMLFDVVVQNGGLYPQDLTDYAAYLKAAPQATSAQKLKKLMELRLRHVRPKYVADVRSRKSAIINGTGTVHGAKRNLPVEYSYDPLWAYR